MIPNSITIFTDGSSRGNPGPGGWGAVIAFSCQLPILPESEASGYKIEDAADFKRHKLAVRKENFNQGDICIGEIGGRESHTTNNRMELQAAIGALSFIEKLKAKSYQLIVYSDSSYVINGITKWVHGWQKNGWKTATKKEVENRDLWEKLIELVSNKNIEWKYIGGHIGIVGNERADVIATEFADGGYPKLYNGPLLEYSIKNVLNLYDISYKKQSVKMASRAHQKAKAYSYVSLVDGKVLVHKTWAECEARVGGKRAKYKKSLSPEDEAKIVAFMKGQ
ncbi:MAG: ribonuclease H [bacterium]|nr:ribonuclease H [bacterium]